MINRGNSFYYEKGLQKYSSEFGWHILGMIQLQEFRLSAS